LFLFNVIGKSEIGKEILKIAQEAGEPKGDLRKLPNAVLNNQNYYNYIEIVTSNQAGLGKTFYIEQKCKNEGLQYINFQLGGEVKRRTIMRRLNELNLPDAEIGLHIDFSDTKQIELFEDFFFSFLIQKCYSNNGDIFCYEDNVKIFIEIPNGFVNFLDKFKILNEFKIHTIENLPEFTLTEKPEIFKDEEDIKYDLEKGLKSFEVDEKNKKLNHYYLYKSNIQMVCNYLKNLDLLDKINLFFYSLIEKESFYDSKGYYLNAKFIEEKECRLLLNKYFNKPNKTYHQIYIYIKVLAEQLRLFTQNYYLLVQQLEQDKIKGDIRKDIIKAFMDLTSYFTTGAFDSIVSE
jgi:hypothetical protein